MAIAVNIENMRNEKNNLDIQSMMDNAEKAFDLLKSKNGKGSDFLGWIELPLQNNTDEIARIKKAAEKIKNDSDALVVIGIGGSYLGARAAVEFVKSPNYNLLKKDTPDIYFAGNGLSADATNEIADLLSGRDFSINVISKSGTTTEPAIAFRIFKKLLEKKYGKEEAAKRIYATTDASKGALRSMADEKGYETFVIPDNVGGRYSVLTAVGLLPMAVCGIDIDEVLKGAHTEYAGCFETEESKSNIRNYVAARNAAYRQGKKAEILSVFEPSLRCFGEWWKQLFGESEGKDLKGIFPASAEFTADLHSLGQYIQQGERFLLETFLSSKEAKRNICVPSDEENKDNLNYLSGRELTYINRQALLATAEAHLNGGIPNMEIIIDREDAEHFGRLVYFFEIACAVSGYMLGVNPFDQPGVEEYKKNMFRLLGKPETKK